MMDYLVGDLQGCCDPLERLLATLAFSPSRDRLFVLGDLVNRGPGSRAVLERLSGLGDAAQCLLGNHDLHLVAVAYGVRGPGRRDTLAPILDDPRREHWIDWLRHRPMALECDDWLCVHAGVLPAWSREDVLRHAAEIETMLRGPDLAHFLPLMYGNEPRRWSDALQGAERWRFIVNVFTRLRFCTADGELEFESKDAADSAPPGFAPWFAHEGRRTAGTKLAFGHWSTLGLVDRPDLLGLDTGCVWGGRLTAARVDGGRREIVQVACAESQRPG
jgi:bis(5'-nucleosyl)-tetraphosphatase (symmetrical)